MRLATGLVALLMSGCVARPVLYPNAKLQQGQSKEDIAACDKLADDYVKNRAAQKAAGDAAEGAAIGAAAGAVTGAVFGQLGRGALSGGLTGAVFGLFRGIFRARQPSPARQGFVNRCLFEKGYDVVGWD
jgi:uncharacterized protein YcfJ